jgi:hypothetical protein
MPVISQFYGIAALMYYYDTMQHNIPHIHVRYAEDEAVISIPDGAFSKNLKIPNFSKMQM